MVYRVTEDWQYTTIAGAGYVVVALVARTILQKKNPEQF
jgi:hypothetical protein